MISAYHRPKTLDEALTLLSQPDAVPLGGGTLLAHGTTDSVRAVDLQLLGLDSLTKTGNELQLGATLTLQTLLESEHCPSAMKTALKLEAPLNIRNTATVAGTLVACDGRSTFATTLLALDAKLTIIVNRKSEIVNLGDFLPLRPRGLITSITVPLHAKFAFDYVARTPSDKPLVCVAVAGWGRRPERVEGSGRRRMAVGGYGKSPMLAMDGTATDDVGVAARNAFHEAEDEWASAEYRMDVAATLARRCADSVNNNA